MFLYTSFVLEINGDTMKKIASAIALFMFLIAGCATQQQIASFKECVAAGNPVMESYPRQCKANGQTFVEEAGIPEPSTEVSFHECTDEQKQNQICTLDYRPVCGIVDNGIRCITTPCASTDAKTYGNACGACADQAIGYHEGACEEREFVICNEGAKGFDPREYAASVNGICVDTCPGNYNSYVTQIGVEVCIEHYGVEEIAQWQTCNKSTPSCECVRAYETTQDEQIDDASYRCVPARYASRMLFRGGLDTLDENGQNSVAIA